MRDYKLKSAALTMAAVSQKMNVSMNLSMPLVRLFTVGRAYRRPKKARRKN